MDIKRTDEKLIKDIEEWNKQEKCIIDDGRTEREKYLEQRCEELESKITNLQEEYERLKQPQIFIDTMDMEERYGEELYKEFLKKQLKDCKQRIKKAIEYINKYCIDDEFYINLTTKEKRIYDIKDILEGSDKK